VFRDGLEIWVSESVDVEVGPGSGNLINLECRQDPVGDKSTKARVRYVSGLIRRGAGVIWHG
jgi:hypothetical protein